MPAYWEKIWEDEFDGPAGTTLAGRVHNGGSAGIGTWTRIDTNGGPNATLDGAGRCYNPPAVGGGPSAAFYAPAGLTLPASGKLRVEIDVYNDGSRVGVGGTLYPGEFGLLLRYQGGVVTNANPIYDEAYLWQAEGSDDATLPYNFYHTNTGPTAGGLGGVLAGGQHVDAGETSLFRTHIEGQGAAPAYISVSTEGVTAFSFYDGQFDPRSNFDTGPPGILMPANYYGNPFRIARFSIYQWNLGSPGSGGTYGYGVGGVKLNHDALLGNYYSFEMDLEHFASGSIDATAYLYRVDGGAYTLLRYGAMVLAHDADTRFSLARVNDVLYCYIGDEEFVGFRFDLATGVSEETGLGVTTLSGGHPGMNFVDSNGLNVRGVLFSVYDLECWADPDNPDPPQGPVPPTLLESALYVKQGGVWVEVDVPSLSNTGSVHGHAELLARGSSEMLVRHQGLWVKPLPEESTPGIDPDDPDVPPYDFRCIDDFPIDYPLPPPAAVGTKKLALYNLTSSMLGDYSPALASIIGSSTGAFAGMQAALLARGMEWWMIPAFRKEQTTDNSNHGPYDHAATMAKFATWSGTAYNTAVLKYVVGFDEYNCSTCWVGSPPTFAQVSAGCSALAGYFSGVPISVRVSPANMLRNDGAVPAGVSVGMAQ
ncbi:MAG: hypothetical protein H0V63_12655, partial [Burkholderiaceae bacterium]|nr:hypothetical protein [Burkholderiaceae bacterium]